MADAPLTWDELRPLMIAVMEADNTGGHLRGTSNWAAAIAKAVVAAQPEPQPAQPLTGAQIKAAIHDAVKAGQLSWTGYEKDEAGEYTVPVLSPKDYQLICAIEAAYGITTSNNTTPAPGEKS